MRILGTGVSNKSIAEKQEDKNLKDFIHSFKAIKTSIASWFGKFYRGVNHQHFYQYETGKNVVSTAGLALVAGVLLYNRPAA